MSVTLPPEAPVDLVAAIAARVAARPAATVTDFAAAGDSRTRSTGDLWRRSGAIAARLADLPALPGEPVLVLVDRLPDLVAAVWGCLRAGAVAVPLASLARDPLAQRRTAVLDAIAGQFTRPPVVTDAAFLPIATRLAGDRAPLPLPPDDAAADVAGGVVLSPESPACLLPTSGSTGRPKLAILSHRALLNRYFAAATGSSQAAVVSCLPGDGISGFRAAFLASRSWTQIDPATVAGTPLAALGAVELLRAESLAMTCSIAAHLLAAFARRPRRFDLGALRQLNLGGEAIVPAIVARLRRLLDANGAEACVIRSGYGTTETGVLAYGDYGEMAHGPDAAMTALCGSPAPGVRLRVTDADGIILDDGATGEIQANCPGTLFSGYWGDPAGGVPAESWWPTGDLGCLSAGQLIVRGRSKEVIVTAGRKQSLADIDAHVQALAGDGVRAIACVTGNGAASGERLAIVLAASAPDAVPSAALQSQIGDAVARRFGLAADRVVAMDEAAIPRLATGKIDRLQLARQVAAAAVPLPVPATVDAAGVAGSATAGQIWCDVLHLAGPPDPEANFFQLGGDSLASAQLFAAVAQRLGCHVPAEEFFTDPCLRNLQRLIAAPQAAAPEQPAGPAWPLPATLHDGMMRYLEAWTGARPTASRLAIGRNVAGRRVPLFWVLQDERALSQMADALGGDQPVYGLRSGIGLIRYAEDEIQAVALRYAAEIAEVCPAGPLLLGGNCQGAVIALAVAQHLLRRRRHLPLLILMEWPGALQPYGGPVLLLHGRDSPQGNPFAAARHPEVAWRRMFPEYDVAEIPGRHGEFFDADNVGAWAAVVSRQMALALARPVRHLSAMARRAVVKVRGFPARLRPGETHQLDVEITNASSVGWRPAHLSGLMLGNYWIDGRGTLVCRLDGRTPLPQMPPGRTVRLALPIRAPQPGGDLLLVVDIIEEAMGWFDPARQSAASARIAIADGIGPSVGASV